MFPFISPFRRPLRLSVDIFSQSFCSTICLSAIPLNDQHSVMFDGFLTQTSNNEKTKKIKKIKKQREKKEFKTKALSRHLYEQA